MGYCADGWWLNQQFCCWEVESDDEFCPSWHPWSAVAPARWLMYVIFAVSLAEPILYQHLTQLARECFRLSLLI